MEWNSTMASVALVVLIVACIILYIVVSYNSDNKVEGKVEDVKPESDTSKE